MPDPTPRYDLLRVLADGLESVRDSAFNMDAWRREIDCGTVGCAMWHAAQMPPLIAEGLRFSYGYVPYMGDNAGFDAAVALFGIGYDDALDLLLEEAYPEGQATRTHVIARIREFVRAGEEGRG